MTSLQFSAVMALERMKCALAQARAGEGTAPHSILDAIQMLEAGVGVPQKDRTRWEKQP